MNVKWLAFFAFTWFFGIIMGSVFEGSSLETYEARGMYDAEGTRQTMTAEKTLEYLFDFSNSQKETTIGSVFWKLAQPDYYGAWTGVLLLDFNFLKEYNSVSGEWHETTQSYFFKVIGTIGLLCFVLMFIQVIQGFIPST